MNTPAAASVDRVRAQTSFSPIAALLLRLRHLAPRRTLVRGPVRRYHSHTSGLLYIGFTLLLAVGAINSQNNLLFLALGLSIGGLLISGILSGASLMGVRATRQVAGRAAVGQPLRIRYRITNANRFVSAFGLHILDVPMGRRAQTAWAHLGRQPRTFVAHVPPSGSVEAEVVLTPRTRGRINLHAVQVWSTFPFGLTRKSVSFSLPRTILVLPPELPLRRGLIGRFATRTSSGVGAENAAGHGEEFFGLREYIAGDSLRTIAWKRTARTGQLVVRQNAMPSPPRLWVAIHFPKRAGGAKGDSRLKPIVLQERAIALAASILRSASESGMSVGLSVPAAKVLHHPREGRAHLERLLTDLAMVELKTDEAPVAPAALARAGHCVIIHAGEIEASAAMAGVHHISAATAEEYLAPSDDAAAAMLALVDSVGADPHRPRRFGRSRAAARRIVGRKAASA